MTTIRSIAAALSALSIAAGAQATTFDYKFTSVISSAQTPGVSKGDVVTLDMFLNNGGTSADSQSWNGNQVVDFTINADGYSATYSKVYAPDTLFSFQTAANGSVEFVQFFGTDPTSHNSDSYSLGFNGDAVFSDPGFLDSRGNYNVIADKFTTTADWQLVNGVSAVPEPTNIALLSAGLGIFALTRRRRA